MAAGAEVEQIKTTSFGGTSAINLTGNEFGQTLTGNAGNNILNGKGGADTLHGGGGSDTFVFNTELTGGNIDTIVDFNAAFDMIVLDHSLFGLPAGELDAGAFHFGTAAADAADRILYDDATGNLYFDANGDEAGSLVQFAQLSAGLWLTHESFVVI
jgi:serralysin